MNTKTKYIIVGTLSLLALSIGVYFTYEWYILKKAYERSGTVDEISTSVKDSSEKLGVTSDDDYEPDDAVKGGSGVTVQSQIAMINGDTFFLNADDGTYVNQNGDIYDPSTDSLTTAGDNATSTHIDANEVTITKN